MPDLKLIPQPKIIN